MTEDQREHIRQGGHGLQFWRKQPLTYEQYLAYLDKLEGMARYPLTTKVENPPDQKWEYRRPFTREEFERVKDQLYLGR